MSNTIDIPIKYILSHSCLGWKIPVFLLLNMSMEYIFAAVSLSHLLPSSNITLGSGDRNTRIINLSWLCF